MIYGRLQLKIDKFYLDKQIKPWYIYYDQFHALYPFAWLKTVEINDGDI